MESFFHELVLNIRCFFYINWCDHRCFLLWPITWWITLIDFQMFNQPDIPEIALDFNVNILSVCCWILFANILLRIFVSTFVRQRSVVFLFCDTFGLIKWVGKYFFSRRNYVKSVFFLCLVKLSSETWAWKFVGGGLLRLFHGSLSFGGLWFSKNWCISLSCS